MKNRRWKIVYEGLMITLVIISLAAMMTNEQSNFRYVHQVIWLIFLIDVLIRFIRASVKWRYVKNNPFDIVTVLPLEEIMLLARFSRFLRLFRYKNIVKRYISSISNRLQAIGFFKLSLYFIIGNIILSFGVFIFSPLGIIESSVWVWANFLKFNYQTDLAGFVVLSIIIKITGLIYFGIVIQELMVIGRELYEKHLKNRLPMKKRKD